MSETAKWLKSRENWLEVVAIPNPGGGFDIALVIDGSYSLESGPQRVARGHLERILSALKADGLPLRTMPKMGVRSLETAEDADGRREQHREAARARAAESAANHDVDGMVTALVDATSSPLGQFEELEVAYLEDEER